MNSLNSHSQFEGVDGAFLADFIILLSLAFNLIGFGHFIAHSLMLTDRERERKRDRIKEENGMK